MWFPKQKRGFTIIELIVVTAVIAMVLSAIVVSFTLAKAKSRDAKRVNDMNEIKKALALYVNNNNRYPIPSGGAPYTVTITSTDEVSTALEGDGVISNTPVDPLRPTYDYVYTTDARGDSFILTFCTETNSVAIYSAGCGHTMSP